MSDDPLPTPPEQGTEPERPEAPAVGADDLREASPEVAPAEPTRDGEPDGSEPAGSGEPASEPVAPVESVEPVEPVASVEPDASEITPPEGAPVPPEAHAPAAAEVGTDGAAVEPGGAKPERLTEPVPGDAWAPAPAPVRRKDLPQRPRRRRKTAAERHRGAFFAKLGELRRGVDRPSAPEPKPDAAQEAEPAVAEQPAAEEPAVEQPVPEPPVAEQPVVEQRVAEQAAPEPPGAEQPVPEPPAAEPPPAVQPTAVQPPAEPEPAGDPSSHERVQARLAAAVERVGGAERIQEALAPKRDEKGEAKKWAAVCCDAAEGLQPGDPVFAAWVRLAATPVREIKAHLRPPRSAGGQGQGRGRPGESRRGGGDRQGGRPGGGGGRPGGGQGGGDRRPRREGGQPRDRSIQDAAKDLLRDGSFKPTVRIVGDDADEKRERERRRKEQREAKRTAERERLARLGY